MKLREQRHKRFTSNHKVPQDYIECKIEQRSNESQHFQLPVLSKASEIAAHVYLGFRRCSEFDDVNHPGQDYAVVRIGGGYVVGVVADGVSRSFYGNLAAKYLSEWLVKELWQRRTATPDEESMDSFLKKGEVKFAESLKNFVIPTDLPATLRVALERRRPKGSQTVFGAFVLEVAKGQLTLYQVGNIKAVIHNSNPEPDLVEAAAEGRWSSAGQSLLLLKKTVSENIDGLVIKSDGVSPEWGHTLEECALDKDQFRQMTEMCSSLDDISFIAVRRTQAGGPAALLPVAQNELLSTTSTDASQQRGDSDFGPNQTPIEKKENATVPALQEYFVTLLEGRGRRRQLKVFMTGAAMGAALMYLVLYASGRLKMGSLKGQHVTQQTDLNPASDKQSSRVPDGGDLSVEVKETEQRKFQKEHASSFPSLISDNPTTKRDEVIAHISTRNVNVERVEFVLSDKEKSATERARNGDRSSFFVRLPGLTKSKTVTIRLVDPRGNVIGEFQEKMRGREKPSAGNKDPFLGYHEISVSRVQ